MKPSLNYTKTLKEIFVFPLKYAVPFAIFTAFLFFEIMEHDSGNKIIYNGERKIFTIIVYMIMYMIIFLVSLGVAKIIRRDKNIEDLVKIPTRIANILAVCGFLIFLYGVLQRKFF